MNVNPVIRKLGLPDDARVVVLHADDIGMCYASLQAYHAAMPYGILSSAATMVPCPWYPETAAFCREHADDPHVDMGVHLTLTSEWKRYRWRPLSTLDHASGLLDDEGYLPRLAAAIHANARIDALEAELRAQVDRALSDGVDATHVDTHMLTLFDARMIPAYLKIALEFQLPPLLLRDMSVFIGGSVSPEEESAIATLLASAEASGVPLFDHLDVLSLDSADNRLEEGKRALASAPAGGLTNILHHMSADSPELRAIAPDWRCRVADCELFTSEGFKQAVADEGVHVIGFRVLRDLMRSELGASATLKDQRK